MSWVGLLGIWGRGEVLVVSRILFTYLFFSLSDTNNDNSIAIFKKEYICITTSTRILSKYEGQNTGANLVLFHQNGQLSND